SAPELPCLLLGFDLSRTEGRSVHRTPCAQRCGGTGIASPGPRCLSLIPSRQRVAPVDVLARWQLDNVAPRGYLACRLLPRMLAVVSPHADRMAKPVRREVATEPSTEIPPGIARGHRPTSQPTDRRPRTANSAVNDKMATRTIRSLARRGRRSLSGGS